MTCSCVENSHPHRPWECDQTAPIQGGVCRTCHDTELVVSPMFQCWRCKKYFRNERHWHLLMIDHVLVGCCTACWPHRPASTR